MGRGHINNSSIQQIQVSIWARGTLLPVFLPVLVDTQSGQRGRDGDAKTNQAIFIVTYAYLIVHAQTVIRHPARINHEKMQSWLLYYDGNGLHEAHRKNRILICREGS